MPSTVDRAVLAAHNNAVWCDAVCRAHGRPGQFNEHLWLNLGETPPFYANAITLARAHGRDAQLAGVRQLLAAKPGHDRGGWSIKDSFCTLDLEPLDCHVLFEATWLWRSPALSSPESDLPGVQWRRLRQPSELAAWERAWAGDQPGELPLPCPIFRPGLLADPDIAFLAAYEGEVIVAGAVVNRSGEVAGLSNVFVPAERHAAFWAACVAAGMDVFGSLPLVNYERDRELATARSLGFEELEPLRVWLHEPAIKYNHGDSVGWRRGDVVGAWRCRPPRTAAGRGARPDRAHNLQPYAAACHTTPHPATARPRAHIGWLSGRGVAVPQVMRFGRLACTLAGGWSTPSRRALPRPYPASD